MQLLFDPTSQLLSQMIHGTGIRHRVLAANLANAETPGYQSQDVTFSTALAEATRGGPAEALPAVRRSSRPWCTTPKPRSAGTATPWTWIDRW